LSFLIKAHPELRIQIEGHCDERGTSEYNLAPGERRARSAQDYLFRVGIAANRISTVSYGEERPFDPGHFDINRICWSEHFALSFFVP
jgi:peptidoglycan-associated lipoprotein